MVVWSRVVSAGKAAMRVGRQASKGRCREKTMKGRTCGMSVCGWYKIFIMIGCMVASCPLGMRNVTNLSPPL